MPDSPQPYRMIIGAASWLVPGSRREEWRQEWTAEIHSRLDSLGRWNQLRLTTRFALALRCRGALIDAAYLRLQSLSEGFWGDVRFGLRRLVKSPGFALSAIVALALGIGANTALFSAAHALLWRTPQVHDPDTLVAVFTADYSSTRFGVSSFPDFQALANESHTLTSVAAFMDSSVRVQFGEDFEQFEVAFVSASYWRTVGVTPVAGRVIEDEFEIGAVIGEELWERHFARNPGVLGKPISLNGRPYPIAGVVPGSFQGTHLMARPRIWVPLRRIADLLGGSESQFNDRRSRSLWLVARLAPNATAQSAQTELDVLARRFAAADPQAWTDVRGKQRAMTVLPLKQAGFDPDARESAGRIAALAFGVIGTLLVTVCATVATMLLARTQARRKEMAIRLSMGAERLRLLRQLLTESGVLCLAGGIGGVALARWSFDWLNRRPELWRGLGGLELQIDPVVLVYAAAVVLASTLLAGAAPAFRASRQDLVFDLKDDCAPLSARLDRSGIASFFVASQVALSLILLTAGALLVRSLHNMQTSYPGFSANGVLLAKLDMSGRRATPVEAFGFVRNLQEHLAATPGVERVAMSSNTLLVDRFGRRGVPVEGYQFAPGEAHEFHVQFAAPGYFETLGIPFLEGGDFSWRDSPGTPRVAIVNETFARKFWPNQSAIGRRLPFPRGSAEVIGVVAPIKFHGVSDPPMPMFFLPLAQEPRGALAVHLKGGGTSEGMAPLLRQRLREFDPQLFARIVIGYPEAIARKALPERFATTLVATAGLLALFLAALGLYGVLIHAVSQSTREIGIRLAVGASRSTILRHVFGRAAWLFLPGAAIGAIGATLFSRLLERWLFGVAPHDPVSMLSVLALLVTVSALAAWLPTRRALRICPLEALRYQ